MRHLLFALALLGFAVRPDPVNAQLFGLPNVPGLSPAARRLVYDHETGGGRAYYDRFLSRISWPGGASGATAGIGYDLAYSSPRVIAQDWRALPSADVARMAEASGRTGEAGRAAAKRLADILVPWGYAESVFDSVTVARYWQLAERIFPGFADLHPDAQGALWSLVYNRGSSMAGPGRVEMREIARLTPSKDYARIAAQIRSMKRLWRGQGLDGLIARREAEARLVEQAGRQ